jgi:lipoprotein-anchoring transpeptidase ErfK/SrfK
MISMQYRTDFRQPPRSSARRGHIIVGLMVAAVLVVGVAVGYMVYHANNRSDKSTVSTKILTPAEIAQDKTLSAAGSPVGKATPVNQCAANSLSQLVVVSISQQHLWACDGSSKAYDSAVVTGMELYPADLTPTGTYHIYGKQTDQTLAGHDSTGSWSDPVSYWMPFLNNQYGTYGFHDATWRSPSDFGNININAPYTATEHGSHGCVELPLATAKWLYGWASVGTTVTIES